MDILTILTFSGALFIFMASPGPGTFAVVAREAIKKPKTQTIMNRFAGSVMVAAGTALIAK